MSQIKEKLTVSAESLIKNWQVQLFQIRVIIEYDVLQIVCSLVIFGFSVLEFESLFTKASLKIPGSLKKHLIQTNINLSIPVDKHSKKISNHYDPVLFCFRQCLSLKTTSVYYHETNTIVG